VVTSTSAEPFWKVVASWQFLSVLGFAVLFWFTSIRIESADLKPSHNLGVELKTSEQYTTEQVLADVDSLPASQMMVAGKTADAISAARQMVRQNPNDVLALMCAGNVLSQNPDTAEDGFKYLRRSVYLAPMSRWVRFNYARKLYEAKRYEEAIPQYEILANEQPEQWTDARYELAQLYMDMKQFDKAVEQLNSALQYERNRGLTYKQIGIAMAAAANTNQDEGFTAFKKGVSLENATDRKELANCPGEVEPLVKQNDGDKAKALAQVEDQIKAQPDDPDLKIEEARLYIACNRLDDAKKALTDLEQKDKDDPDVFETKAQLLLMQNDETGAKQAFQEAVKLTHETT
jgi:predicted Zn-dependent protease